MEKKKIKIRNIAVFLFMLTMPYLGVQGQNQHVAENMAGSYPEGRLAGTEKMEPLKNQAFHQGVVMIKKDVEIVLTVDVDSILSSDNPDEGEIIKYCSLSDDNNGQGNVKDFKSQIYGGKYVEWKAKSKGRGTVKFVLISINSDNQVPFEEGYILNRKGIKGRTKGRVKTEDIIDKEISNYTIYFKIKKGFRTYGPYRIDPKLQANT